jgi:hypothetical protein
MQRNRTSNPAVSLDSEAEAAHAAAFPEHRRAIGFYVTTTEDVAYLWREAKQYMDQAERQSDPRAAERLAHMGCEFAVMAVALLSELSEAAAGLDAYIQPRRGLVS